MEKTNEQQQQQEKQAKIDIVRWAWVKSGERDGRKINIHSLRFYFANTQCFKCMHHSDGAEIVAIQSNRIQTATHTHTKETLFESICE